MSTATEERKDRRRAARYRARIQAATSAKAELWAAIGWLVAEAVRASRVNDTTQAVLALVGKLRRGQRFDTRPSHDTPDTAHDRR